MFGSVRLVSFKKRKGKKNGSTSTSLSQLHKLALTLPCLLRRCLWTRGKKQQQPKKNEEEKKWSFSLFSSPLPQ